MNVQTRRVGITPQQNWAIFVDLSRSVFLRLFSLLVIPVKISYIANI